MVEQLLMESTEIEKSLPFNIAETVDYLPGSVINRTIYKKITGTIKIIACDLGESLPAKVIPFDTFIQVIDGQAEITIDEKSFIVRTGESIILPSHSHCSTKAIRKFKMISTVIKSGYEEES